MQSTSYVLGVASLNISHLSGCPDLGFQWQIWPLDLYLRQDVTRPPEELSDSTILI